jgi:hypothetical protein
LVYGKCAKCGAEGLLHPRRIAVNNKGLCENCFPLYDKQYCELQCGWAGDVLEEYQKHLEVDHLGELAGFITNKAKEKKDSEFGLNT